jgi:hypothetical protein
MADLLALLGLPAAAAARWRFALQHGADGTSNRLLLYNLTGEGSEWLGVLPLNRPDGSRLLLLAVDPSLAELTMMGQLEMLPAEIQAHHLPQLQFECRDAPGVKCHFGKFAFADLAEVQAGRICGFESLNALAEGRVCMIMGRMAQPNPCKRAKHQHDDDWPFKLALAQFELYLELQEKGEFNMLELPSRRPDAFTADDVAEVVQHFQAMKEAWRRLKQ